jgi:hypothetical protein
MNLTDLKRQEILNALKTSKVHVQFKKVKDGEIRNMYCTLNADFIPEEHLPKTPLSESNAPNTEVIRAYDMEVEGWRSFRLDSLIEYRTSDQHKD